MSNWKKRLEAGALALVALALAAVPYCPAAGGGDRQALGEAKIPAGPYVALTFDDGPRDATTPVLLDGLAQRGVRATFFVIGENVEGNELLLQRMEGEGHQIGLHTYHHKMLDQLNAAGFYAEVDSLRATLTALVGREEFMLRPPYGMMNAATQTRAAAPIVLWSVDPEDWSAGIRHPGQHPRRGYHPPPRHLPRQRGHRPPGGGRADVKGVPLRHRRATFRHPRQNAGKREGIPKAASRRIA